MNLSGELSYRIGYDVEHDLFHAQNVFNDEYIKPTFIEYVQKLEKENTELKDALEGYKQNAKWCDKCDKITDLEKENKVLAQNLEDTEIINKALEKENAELKSIADFQQSGNMSRYFELKRQAEKLEEAKELLKKLLVHSKRYIWIADDNNKPIMQKEIAEVEQFLSEVEK